MSFGLTAAQVGLIGAGAGLLMGGSGGSNNATATTQNQIDPRLVPYLYGNGSGGLVGDVNSLYQQQSANGGLNPLQLAGLEMQRQTLMSPAYTQGFDQMRNLGSSLMGAGVAGNPFGNTMAPGRDMSIGSPIPQSQALGFGQTAAAYQPIQPMTKAAAPVQAPVSSGAQPSDPFLRGYTMPGVMPVGGIG